ncbi:MAG: hypothetical protein MZV64_30870 [Ignavibacteriales bacterium]|nr:hypothetical protein [Ignavibacteriales bacterium]
MTSRSFPIRFLPDGRAYQAEAAVELCARGGRRRHPASNSRAVRQGRRGALPRCGSSTARRRRRPARTAAGSPADELDAGWRLACQLQFRTRRPRSRSRA